MLGQYVAAGNSWSYDLLKLKVDECTKLTWTEHSHALKVYKCTKLTWTEHSHALKVYKCTKLTWTEHSHSIKLYECTKLTWAEYSHILNVYECTTLIQAEHSHTLPNNWPTAVYHHPNCSTAKNLSTKILAQKYGCMTYSRLQFGSYIHKYVRHSNIHAYGISAYWKALHILSNNMMKFFSQTRKAHQRPVIFQCCYLQQ